jgi:hypothetical protein
MQAGIANFKVARTVEWLAYSVSIEDVYHASMRD